MGDDYQFEDAETASAPAPASEPSDNSFIPRGGHGGAGGGGEGGSYADEIFSRKINAKFRTFFVDLKESSNGKFVKISEKSHGRKSTVMMDCEDLPAIIDALQEVQKQL